MRAGYWILGVALLLGACKKETPDIGVVKVKLTEAPAEYDAINLDIRKIKIHTDNSHPKADWIELTTKSGVYDLLMMNSGGDALIAEGEVPAGPFHELKVELGADNSVVVGGETYRLEVPPNDDPTLKFTISEQVDEGEERVLLMDFAASRSIVKEGNKYILKPRLRAIAEDKSGSIKGKVDPLSSSPTVYVIGPGDSISSNLDANGEFLIRALEPGTYRLAVIPQAPYKTTVLPWVGVAEGEVKDVGLVTVSQ